MYTDLHIYIYIYIYIYLKCARCQMPNISFHALTYFKSFSTWHPQIMAPIYFYSTHTYCMCAFVCTAK